MGPVAGGRGSRGAPCNGLQLARPAAGGVIVARVAMAPGDGGMAGSSRVAWQEGMQLQQGGAIVPCGTSVKQQGEGLSMMT